MSSVPQNVLDLPLEERALLALRAAVKEAIAEHAREGLPVYVWSGGRVVELPVGKLRARPRSPSKRGTRKRKTHRKAADLRSRSALQRQT